MDSKHAVTLLLIGAYFLIVLVSLRRRGREIAGPWWFLLRSFFPNWRFYHDVGHQPRLFLRQRSPDGIWSDWSMYVPRARFRTLDLLHNPVNNLELAQQNLVDHLSADVHSLADDADAGQLVSYRLVDRLARELLRREPANRAGGASPGTYQFEVRLIPPLAGPTDAIAILTSPEQAWT